MPERDIPGKQDPLTPLPLHEAGKFLHGTPTVPLKRHARGILRDEDIDPKTSRAIIEFVEAAYWIESGVGDPALHQQRAVKTAQRVGLSEEGIVAVSQRAEDIYRGYKESRGVTSDDVPLTYGLVAAIEARRKEVLQEERKQREERAKLPSIFRDRYEKLMAPTDDQLRTTNSNERIVFLADPAYRQSARGLQRRIEKRALTEDQYKRVAKRQEDRAAKKDREEDPFERVAHVYGLAESNKPKDRKKLVALLGDRDPMIQEAAIEALDQIGWRPQTSSERALYHVANGDWDKAMMMGEEAVPAIANSMRSQDETLRNRALDILVYQDWKPQDAEPRDSAPFYALRREWSKLTALGNAALPTLQQLLKEGGGEARIAAVSILQQLDTVNALSVLSKFRKDDNEEVSQAANEATRRLSENPFYLQKLQSLSPGTLGRMKIPLARALLAVNPEWANRAVSEEEARKYADAIAYLPPVGGKIPVVIGKREGHFRERLNPSMVIEEQIQLLAHLRQEGGLGKGYVHQLTVQGRLPDEFKYTAIALILSSPYPNDWTKPFFETVWGKVAPLIHDGGNVKMNVNPLWSKVAGRTDFLQRIVPVHQPKLERMEQLSPEEKIKLPVNELAEARTEQFERERLITEAKAYQRLALALHAQEGTAPSQISPQVREHLASIWSGFKLGMGTLLHEYGIQGVAEVRWFHDEAKELTEWGGYGRRHEADWEPIQGELIKMEDMRNNPQLRSGIIRLLRSATTEVDREIGLLPREQN